MHRHLVLVFILASACGGGGTEQPPVVTPTPQEPPPSEPVAENPPSEPPPTEPTPPAEAPLEPYTATTADQVKQALFEAATDIVAFRRLIDPEWGIGVYDHGDAGLLHHCEMDELASAAGIGFVINESDAFRCNGDLTRCSVEDADGHGYAFHMHRAGGDVIQLRTIVRYDRRVPRADPEAVTTFARAGDGVCDLWRSLTRSDAQAPRKFSVFVSAQTGLVPETVAAHPCGDEAAAAWTERVAPVASQNPPQRCTRGPARCTYVAGDEEVTVYGNADGPFGVAVTRPGMAQNLDRAQRRDLEQWLLRAGRQTCN